MHEALVMLRPYCAAAPPRNNDDCVTSWCCTSSSRRPGAATRCRTRRSHRSAVPCAAHPSPVAPLAAPRPWRPTAGSDHPAPAHRDRRRDLRARPAWFWRRCRLAVGRRCRGRLSVRRVRRRRSGRGGVGAGPEQLGERVTHGRPVADLVVVHHRHADQPRIRRRGVAGARRGVHRLDVEQATLGHRQRQQIAPPDPVLVVAADDTEVLADRGVGGDRVVGQLRPVDLARNRQHRDLAVRRRIGTGADVGGQEVAPEPVHRAGQLERRRIVVLRNVFRDDVVRRLVAAGRRVRVQRHVPEVRRREERHRIVDVVLGQQRPLHLEQVLGVAQVRLQLRRDVALRLDRAGEHLHPRLQHRVLLVLRVQRDGAVVGVDGGLHRVADVGHLLVRRQPVERHLGGVGGGRSTATSAPSTGSCPAWCSRRRSTPSAC